MERTNFRYVKPEDLHQGMPNFATIDVSFISLKLILPVLKTLLVNGSDIVTLIKPQFEAGREEVGKKGVIREPKIHRKVINEIITFSLEQGYNVTGLDYSPIKGGEGNIEFLLLLHWKGTSDNEAIKESTIDVDKVVEIAHQSLKNQNE